MAIPAPRVIHSDSWLDSCGESFEVSLLNEDYSPDTLRTYRSGLKHFFNYLRDQGVDDMHYITREHIEGFQASLRHKVPPIVSSTRGIYSTAVRQLLTWAAHRDIVDWRLPHAVAGVRRRHSNEEPRPIPPDDLEILFAHLGPRRPGMTVMELRDRALFHYLFVTTGRVREALQATRRDYLRARVRQKGGSMHDLRTVPTLVRMIEDYLAARTDDLPCLWAAHGNNVHAVHPLQSAGVLEIWKRMCIELGITRFTTHQLRHTGMTELGEAEVADSVIADRAGHKDLRTIHRYMKVRESQRLKADAAMEQRIRIDRPRLLPKVGHKGYGR